MSNTKQKIFKEDLSVNNKKLKNFKLFTTITTVVLILIFFYNLSFEKEVLNLDFEELIERTEKIHNTNDDKFIHHDKIGESIVIDYIFNPSNSRIELIFEKTYVRKIKDRRNYLLNKKEYNFYRKKYTLKKSLLYKKYIKTIQ